MGHTIAEKIIARCAGKKEVNPGELVYIEPDYIGAYNMPEPPQSPISTFPDIEKMVGVDKIVHPERIIMMTCHAYYPINRQEDINQVNDMRAWALKYGVSLYDQYIWLGLQSVAEMGLVLPGMLFAHHDAEVGLLGGIGALAIGTMPLIELYVAGNTWLEVPPTIKINLYGELPPGTLSCDVMHWITSQIGFDGAIGRIIEFGGPLISRLETDARMTLCNMYTHLNAVSAIVNPDEKTAEYVKQFTDKPFDIISSDPDAHYERVYNYDVSNLEPYIACPPNVNIVRPLQKMKCTIVEQGLIGTCGGGRMEDLRAAAKILKGRHVTSGFRLYVVPVTAYHFKKAIEEGLIDIIVDAGAFISSHSCSYCNGTFDYVGHGEAAITTNTLNIPGRMGSMEADIYLANAYAIAAASIEGRIVDPRNYL